MKLLFTILLIALGVTGFSQSTKTSIKVLSAKDGFFHFKATGKFRGALVEVFDESRKLVAKSAMTSNKMLIDFFDAAPGTYQIEISVLETRLNFQYTLDDSGHDQSDSLLTSQVSFYQNSLSIKL